MIRTVAERAVLAILAVLPSAARTAGDDAQAWREDLRFMAKEMERTHKNLYHTVSREQFAEKVAALDAKIPSLARHEVIVELAKIVAAVGDGHTNLYPTREPKIGFRSLPVAFTFFGDGLYVRAAHESQRALVGGRVLRIGDRDVADAYSEVKAMIGRDNEWGAVYWAPHLLAMPEVLHALRITASLEDVPLGVLIDGKDVKVVLHPFEPVRMMSGEIVRTFERRDGWVDARDLSGRPDPPWLRRAGEAFHLETVGSVLYVQINQILDDANETLVHFAQRLHDEIASTKPEKVAIDLRLDRGGNGMLLVPIVRALIQSTSIDRKGRLFVIIGPGTFSAAQMLVDSLEKNTNATFVGEPTSSKGNAYGDSRKIVLPNSGLTVRASIYYWQDWHPMDDRDATIPQISAPLTIDAYRANVDPALQAIERAEIPESSR